MVLTPLVRGDSQSQGIKLDETLGVSWVICAIVSLEGRDVLIKKRVAEVTVEKVSRSISPKSMVGISCPKVKKSDFVLGFLSKTTEALPLKRCM